MINYFLNDYKELDNKIIFILFGLFLISLGNYIIVPYLAVYLLQDKHISMSIIGIIIATRLLSQRGLILFGGQVVDYFGCKVGMLFGILVRAVSFIILMISTDILFLFVFAILNGLGSALYQPSAKTALTLLVPSEQRYKVFGIRNVVINLGVSVGPLLGALLFSVSFEIQVLVSASIYLFIFIVGYKVLPKDQRGLAIAIKKHAYLYLFKDKYFITLLLVQCLFFIFYSQFELILPIYITKNIGNYGAGVMYTINALTVILLQQPISKKLKNFNKLYYSFQLGVLLTGAGILILLSSYDISTFVYLSLLLGTVIFTLGEIIMTVLIDIAATEIVHSSLLGRGFALVSLFGALASMISNLFFGWIYNMPKFIFIIMFLFFIVILLSYFLLKVFKQNFSLIKEF